MNKTEMRSKEPKKTCDTKHFRYLNILVTRIVTIKVLIHLFYVAWLVNGTSKREVIRSMTFLCNLLFILFKEPNYELRDDFTYESNECEFAIVIFKSVGL